MNAELALLKKEATIFRDYAKTLNGKDTDPSTLSSFLEIYRNRQKEIDDEGMKISRRIDVIDDEWTETRNQITEEEKRASARGVRITVVVMASGDGEAELSLSYMVSNAWWWPQYDVRAAIAKDATSQSTVGVHYRASITQRTGEDWTNVDLTLSTASPQQGTAIPKLRPNMINVPTPMVQHPQPSMPIIVSTQTVVPGYVPPTVVYSGRSRSRSRSYTPPRVIVQPSSRHRRSRSRSRSRGYEEEAWERGRALQRREAIVGDTWTSNAAKPSQPQAFFVPNNSNAVDGAVSTTFVIPGLSCIPTATDDSQQTHKVSISEINFDTVDMEWIAVPKGTTKVFLQVSSARWCTMLFLTSSYYSGV